MLSKEDFVRRILDGAPKVDKADSSPDSDEGMLAGFDAFDVTEDTKGESQDARFAQLLLEESGFGRGEILPRNEVVLGDQKTNRFLPHGVTYWAKTTERPFHILLFDLELKGSDILSNGFFRKNDQLEDALHRIVQDALEGFERGGEGRTADRKQGAQIETLCVVSVTDDRRDGPERQLVCFGTKSTETAVLEVFTLREAARDWDRPLAEEHLAQLFERHFKRLATGARWQDAFVSGEERKKARRLMDACAHSTPDEKQLQTSIRDLLDEIAGSFGLRRNGGKGGHRLVMHAMPEDHSIAVDPRDARKNGFKNPFQGIRIFDADERLIGYIVYVLDSTAEAEQLRSQLAQNNHFHNVLVVYPEKAGATLELWQGPERLRGRLINGTRRSRFDGEGGVIQLLSRFFVVSRSAIKTPGHLAAELAWRAQHLKVLAIDELRKEDNKPEDQRPLRDIHDVFNQALATLDETQFADTYAQTITYGLLAARWLSSGRKDVRFTRKNIASLLPSTSAFLHDLFQRLVNSRFDQNLSWLLDDITSLLSRTMVAEVFKGEQDPSIHFYQDFLDAYDPQIRRRMGVYYTPEEVVEYIVRSLDQLARERLGLRLGLADSIKWGEYAQSRGIKKPEGVNDDDFVVQILDPACGTGTFPLQTIELIFETMIAEYERLGYDDERAAAEWKKYVRNSLLPRVNAFELMMAPYIVTHLRLGLALEEGLVAKRAQAMGFEGEATKNYTERWGFKFGKKDRLRVFLTNTLELHSNHQLDWLSPHVVEEAREAESLKMDAAILVMMGNPPYERISADRDTTADWILKGKVPGRTTDKSLFDDIRDIARENTIFSHLRSLPDRYVYFWRWALWKGLEQADRPNLIGLITNSTWLNGPGFMGLRKIVREQADEAWSIDLGGDNRGTYPEPNIFHIETPVAITTLIRESTRDTSTPAVMHYYKVNAESVGLKLEHVSALAESPFYADWKQSKDGWLETFVPVTGEASWQDFPALSDLFPWRQPGCLVSRTWPIAPHKKTLAERWRSFVTSPVEERPSLYATAKTGRNIFTKVPGYPTLASLTANSKHEPIVRYCLRSFDRQWVFEDPRLLKTESPSLWRTLSTEQIYLCSLMSVPIAAGPSITATAYVPDFHHFRGSYGGKDVMPLYRDAAATQPNITMGLLNQLGTILNIETPSPKDFAAYVYALLSALRYQERFAEALKTPGPRVPLTRDAKLWAKAVSVGKKLLWMHTYTERFRGPEEGRNDNLPEVSGLDWVASVSVPPQNSTDINYDPDEQVLMVGNGKVKGVRPDVWNYSVSGMQVVPKWLGYRTARGAGRAASSSSLLDQIRPSGWLDEWNDELIELLTVLTITMDLQSEQAMILDAICQGALISTDELPQPIDAERKEPKIPRKDIGDSTAQGALWS